MKHKNDSSKAMRAVRKEMARPRIARSARIAELNLDASRISERPSTTLAGRVDRIIPVRFPDQSEKAQIVVDGSDAKYRDLRIENKLTDEHGDDVRLKKGARVAVTVSTKDPARDT